MYKNKRMNWDSLIRICVALIILIIQESGGSPDAVSTGSNEAPWMWMSTGNDRNENNSGTEVLEVVELIEDPHVMTAPIELNTEPRFVGHLRRKLCKVGLGIGNEIGLNCDHAETSSPKIGRSKRSPSPQFLRINEDDLDDADRAPNLPLDQDQKGGRSVEGIPSGINKNFENKSLHDEPEFRILKTIGNVLSKLPLHYANFVSLKNSASPETPIYLGGHPESPLYPGGPPESPNYSGIHSLPHLSHRFQPSLGTPEVYPMETPMHPMENSFQPPFMNSLHTNPNPPVREPIVPQNSLRKTNPILSGFSFPKSGEEPPIYSPLIEPNFISPSHPSLPHLRSPLPHISNNEDSTRNKRHPITTDLHDQRTYYKTQNPTKYPYEYFTKDASQTHNACSFVNCKELFHYCPSFIMKKMDSRQLHTTHHITGNDLPFSCGLHEVCCNIDNIESSLNHVDVSVPSRSSSEPRSCGRSTVDAIKGRITGGLPTRGETKFGEFPWQAAILKKEGNDNVYVCAGSLIDKSHVLTAAHCVEGYTAGLLRVRLGEWDVNRDTEFYPHVEYDVVGLAIHPDFYSGNLINDIAIVRMLYPIDLNKMPHISPVCLPTPGFSFAGSRCWVSGWGKNAFGKSGKYQNLLKKVDLPIIPRQTCNAILRETRLGPGYSLHPGMMCAGGEPKRDACKGDGGGPLSCKDIDGNFVLSGIVSWGIGCGQPGVPGIYINVEYYVGWLRQMIES